MAKPSMSALLDHASRIKNRNDRIQFLKNNYSKQLHEVLAFGYDPRIRWNLPLGPKVGDGDPPYKPLDSTEAGGNLYHDSRKLYLFVHREGDNLTDGRRQQLFVNFLEGLDPDDAKLILSCARKKIPYKGIDQKLIEEAFGEYNG